MNEDGTPIEAAVEVADVSTDNISAADGGVTTTPEEVASVLNLPKVTVADDKGDEDATDETDASDADDSADDAGDSTDSADDANTEAVVEPAEKVVETPVAPVDVASDTKQFELVVEDVNGEKITLKPGDDLEQALKDFEPKSNGQIFKIIDDFQQLRAEQKTFNDEQTTKAAEAEQAQELATIQSGWDKEIASLQGNKRVPVTVDGSANERVTQVFDFMGKENDARVADGRPLLRSFEDALDKLELRETKEAAAQAEKDAKELARAKGGVVGGSSAPATSGAPVYKGGARNANEALKSLGVI